MPDFAVISTERLELSRPTEADVAEVVGLHADPQVWEHYPGLRHQDPEQTRHMLAKLQQAWDRDGLGSWLARSRQPRDAGALAGIAGCTARGRRMESVLPLSQRPVGSRFRPGDHRGCPRRSSMAAAGPFGDGLPSRTQRRFAQETLLGHSFRHRLLSGDVKRRGGAGCRAR